MNLSQDILTSLQTKVKQLEDERDSLLAKLQARDAIKYVFPSREGIHQKRDTFIRVFLCDLHGAYADPEVLPVLFDDLRRLQVSEVILGGDMVDAGGFLAEHHTLGFVAEMDYTYEDDLHATNQFLDTLQQVCSKASITYLQGNHEWRVDRWVVNHCAGKKKDASFLLKQISPTHQLYLEKRGIEFIHALDKQEEMRVGGTIRRGRWCYTHKASGRCGGATAGQKALSFYSSNVVFAHTHTPTLASKSTVTESLLAINPGCLCKIQPVYAHTDPTSWRHGYLLQVCDSSGDALSIPITIDNGVSLLRYLWGDS